MSTHAFDALGNPTRREILRTLQRRPLTVNEIAARFPVTRPAVSRHLRLLSDAGLVEARVEGRQSRYAVRVEGLKPVRDFLDEFWDTALARLERLARR